MSASTEWAPIVDDWLRGLLSVVGRTGLRPPVARLLARRSADIADELFGQHRPRAMRLAPRAAQGELAARVEIGSLAEQALAELRARLRDDSPGLSTLDGWWHRTDLSEWLDDPSFDERRRVRALAKLDALNLLAGGQDSVHRALRPFLREGTPEHPARILDLAAGHAGLALDIARRARIEGLHATVRATDLKPEYLALAQPVVNREKLSVELAVQDALDLRNLSTQSYAVVLCTQSLHHFAPAQVTRMVAEASRVASGAVVLFDLCRSAAATVALTAIGLARYRDTVLVHDGIVSYRRAYTPAELTLLARLGAPHHHTQTTFEPPAHTLIVLHR